jgi:hypothetical protein
MSSDAWFVSLFGVTEQDQSYVDTKALFRLIPDTTADIPDGIALVAPNGRFFPVGAFATPSVAELRAFAPEPAGDAPRLLVYSHFACDDALALHAENPCACFQAASQFNALEFPSPDVVPEDGVTGYAWDRTQGPACSLAAAAGTVFRNYFALVPGAPTAGQTKEHQLNLLQDLLDGIRHDAGKEIHVQNGYAKVESLDALSKVALSLARLVGDDRELLLEFLRVGVHRRVGVTYQTRWKELDAARDTRVTQVFCSALSIAYHEPEIASATALWAPLAKLILDATYEAVILQAFRDVSDGVGSSIVFLTFVGGGVFGNEKQWIADAIGRALKKFQHLRLDVRICHYRKVDESMRALVDESFAKS